MRKFVSNLLEATYLEVPDSDSIGPATEFRKLPKWDSIAMVGLILMLDVKYGKKVVVQEILRCKTIEDLFKLTQ